MTPRLLIVVALVLLSACGNVPRPFSYGPKVTTDNPLLDVPTAVGIAVVPVRGAPEPLNTQISSAVALRLQSFDIPAEAVPVNRGLGFTLEGEARPTNTEGETTAAEVSLVVTWTLRSRRGVPVRTYRQVVSMPAATWQGGSTETAAKLGNDAALAMGDLINGIAIPAQGPVPTTPVLEAQAAPPMPKFPTISVKPVEGAPGDGRESLRLAVLQALSDNGVKRDDVQPQVTLTCQMTSTPYDSSSQKVEIVWRAMGRDGKELGTVKLDNTIPNGALDGPWGPTAYAVAAAALNDLLTLLASHATVEPAAAPLKK